MEWPLVLKNTTGSVLFLSSLGWNMPTGSSSDILNGEFTWEELANAMIGDLGTSIDSGDVVVNDGTDDLSAADGTDYITRGSKKYIDDQDDELTTNITNTTDGIQTEVDNMQSALGLDTDGTFIAHSGTNYMDSASTAAAARVLLDSRAKTNADNISTNTSNISSNTSAITANATAISNETSARQTADAALQTEIDNIEAATGLNANGTFNAHSGTNYMDGASTGKAARELLDAQVKTNEDDIDTLGTSLTTGLAAKVNKAGDTMTGDLNMGANEVLLTTDPSTGNAAARKSYVDMMVQGVAPKANVVACTTDPLDACTYDNGTDGVGATLTADASGALSDIDDVTMAVGSEILVAGQATDLQNGVYVVTTLGDASNPWVLTRRDDMDGSPNNEFLPGATVPVSSGTEWAGFMFYLLGDAGTALTVGTDDIEFSYIPGNAATSNLQGEVDNIETAVGLNADGTFIAHSGSNYMDSASTAKEARELLDAQTKTNTDNIATNTSGVATNASGVAANASAISALQSELGNMMAYNGAMYALDSTRGKWLGPREVYTYGLKNKARNRYLEVTGGILSNNSSVRMDRNMTITALSIQLSATYTGSVIVEIRKNGSTTAIGTVTLSNAAGAHDNTLDIDVVAGDYLQVYINGGQISNPFVKLTAAYMESV